MPVPNPREFAEILRDLWKEVREYPSRKWAKFLLCLGLFLGWMFLLWISYQMKGELAPGQLIVWTIVSLLLGYYMFIKLLGIFYRYDIE